MKLCNNCGYRLEGFEKFCPECGKQFKEPEDREDFIGSIFNQFSSDMNDIKEETLEFFNDLKIDDVIDDFSTNSQRALNRDATYVSRARIKLENSGDNNRIIRLCNKAILINDRNWEAYHIKGKALINLGRYDEGIEELISSLALKDDNLEARCYIAKAYYLKGDTGYSIKVYDSILNVDDKHPGALKGKALIFFDQENYYEANKYFERANNVTCLSRKLLNKWDVCTKKLKEE
ncbi:tetratricopeptide repeat protein [Methanobrevibacter millerae]|uniref:Uncharacterized protein n=1 Tax=Methanobrevibacter millerae TaxID=230361 RepID=A0A1G5VEI7_9EURY|nr:hypothetical protein [Methanobrevibacter millerae]SDA43455.1 hypothetical protein SAMN02910315_00529 [Methanobrevibacter millerae]